MFARSKVLEFHFANQLKVIHVFFLGLLISSVGGWICLTFLYHGCQDSMAEFF